MSKENLNQAQREAVETLEGPLLILAGAGAGKTKTLVERIVELVRKGTPAENILAITFTNKAAKEMRERVAKRLSEERSLNLPTNFVERPFVSTFHSLGVYILRENASKIGLTKLFNIFDREDSRRAIKEVLEKLSLDPKEFEPGRILAIISKKKGEGLSPGDEPDFGRSPAGLVAERVWPEYEKVLKRDNALDFDDLLLKAMQLLKTHPEIRERYRQTWNYIHIDEYQDTNRVQYEIARMLVGPEKNICVVGDIDQNIYSWRGADLKNILDFEKDYPEAKTILLEENYRSSKNILEASNAIIEKNRVRRDKKLFTSKEGGEKISLIVAFDEADEARRIAEKAGEIIRSGKSPAEIAVLFRANFQSRALEEAFLLSGLPYQLLGTKFFERKEVKDVIAYLRSAKNPESLADIKRVINTPARGLGKTSVLKIFAGEESSLPAGAKLKLASFRSLLGAINEFSQINKLSEVLTFIIRESGLEAEWKEGGEEGASRLENAFELVNFARRYDQLEPEESLTQFLSDSALQSDQDELEEKREAVRLMTVHAAKGLEFDFVFVSGLEDGLFPHEKVTRADLSPEESEEERRLFYVALTRAREKLYLSYAQTRTVFGRRGVNMPSEFIADIPEHLLEAEDGDEFEGRRPLLDIEF